MGIFFRWFRQPVLYRRRGRPRVMLAAHMDEIGFLVQNIASNGFLQLVGIGGWWPHTLLSQRVLVKNRSGRGIRG